MADELAVCPCGQVPEKLIVEGPEIYKSRARVTDYSAGQLGTSDAPGNCPDCGAIWANSERLHTGDDEGIGGWEDWLHCKSCGCEIFYPVTHRVEGAVPSFISCVTVIEKQLRSDRNVG